MIHSTLEDKRSEKPRGEALCPLQMDLFGSDRAEARQIDHQLRGVVWTEGAENVAVPTVSDRTLRDRDPALFSDRLQHDGEMSPLMRFAVVLLAGLALSACSEESRGGGLGQACRGFFAADFPCEQGLTCNFADGNVCEVSGSEPANGACSSDDLCASGLWCEPGEQKCRPFLKDGDVCSDPFSRCGPTLACVTGSANTAVCGQPAATAATVIGTLTLPAKSQAAKGMVSLFTTLPPAGTSVTSSIFVTTGGASVDYEVPTVPAGTYFILATVDVDGSGGTSSTPGDYAGWYGHNGDGNPPAMATAVVPATGTVRFDFSLVLR
jgi:hypothetical protein